MLKKNKTETRVLLMQGNEACVSGAIAAGVNFFAGYPITPATEIAEGLAKNLPAVGGKFIQMEDEISCMSAVIGASLAGARSMTATSGPGFDLMQENLGYAAMIEAPCVVVCVQRGGPSTGLPTLPSQADVMMSRWGSHGDFMPIVLSPYSVRETYDLTIESFNLAEKYRTPVILLTDAAIGHMREKTILPSPDEIRIVHRKKPIVPPEKYIPYQPDSDGVPPMANLGEGYRYYITGCVHNEEGSPVLMDPEVATSLIRRLHNKIENNREDIIKYENIMTQDAEIIVLAYGCVARAAKGAVKSARNDGIKVGLFRPITLWPSSYIEMVEAAKHAHTVIVPEMNIGQYSNEVSKNLHNEGIGAKVVSISEVGGILIHPNRILSKIREVALNG